ncbi:MAG: DNA topoisomerase 4 subunit A [Lachnospiraceae bacterium]|nr:DNA topoisomerase 4 subunit A [Lachnospiraceae bacterium]
MATRKKTAPEPVEEQIIKTEYSELMQKSFVDYAMSVIVARALPDVRDGLKPVQRRVLYDMTELGIHYDRPYRKSARIVGDTMGKYHPHGDSSIYDSLVVMAQDFKKELPLVDGHGNFGNIEGDSAAAMRYTEARLQKITEEGLLADLDKDVVDFVPNFDETEKEPSVLPALIPNFLINGSEGIAVGMATSTPTHNVGEAIDAEIALIEDPELTSADLMRFLPGPDFPTGGIVINQNDLQDIYETGTGKIKLRGRLTEEKGKAGHINLVITEIPYTMIGSGIGKFLSDVAALSENKLTNDIVDISNQSSKEGIRIVIELRKDADVPYFKTLLYKKTKLEDTFGVNMLAIKDGRPETLGLKQILQANIDFAFEVTRRKYENLLRKEQDRREIQEGLIKACNVIDLVIEILRGSTDRNMAKRCLVQGDTTGIRFKQKESAIMAAQLNFTDRQADAILEMRLYKLIGLELNALIKEHEETVANIYKYEDILEQRSSMTQVIRKELLRFKKSYASERKTTITQEEEVVYVKKAEEEIDVVFLMDRFGYAKTIDMQTYERNKETADSENRFAFVCKNTGKVCIFTNTGALYTVKVSDLPMSKLKDKGKPIDNVSGYDSTKEDIVCITSQSVLNLYRVLFVTKEGMIKLVDGGEFDVTRKAVAATLLGDKDTVVSVVPVSGEQSVVLQTKAGFFLKFPMEEIPMQKKTARGVRGIKLGKDDEVEMAYVLKTGESNTVVYHDHEVDLNHLKTTARGGKGTKK